MTLADCKPGRHLWIINGYEGTLEVEVLEPLEPLYQDFIWVKILQCPPGYRSPRYIRLANMYATRKDALKAAINELDKSLCEYSGKIARLEKLSQEKNKTKQKLIELYDKEIINV